MGHYPCRVFAGVSELLSHLELNDYSSINLNYPVCKATNSKYTLLVQY
jgi:hypothetical protein